MIPLVTAAQMRALDSETIGGIGVPGAALMESAGRGVVARLWALHRDGAVDLRRAQVLVVAGPGNNGGDGLVVARYLHQRGVAVEVLLCAERERVRGDALLQLHAAEAVGAAVRACPGEEGAAGVAARLAALGAGDLVVDALFGTGLTRAVTGPPATVIRALNRRQAGVLVVAVDLPSGLDADRGEPEGSEADPAIVRADHTVTFAYPKLGLCGAPGFTYAGTLDIVDIGIPPALCEKHGVRAGLLEDDCLAPLWRPRPPLGHKGSHGHLLIVAGSPGKTGAALLCASGAQRAGVGLCTVAAPPAAQQALQGRVLEVMTAHYDPGRAGPDLLQLAEGKRALAIGPGLPTGPGMKDALLQLLKAGDAPAVLDADALNLLAGDAAALRGIGRPLVLTPHPGEAARLLGCDTAAVQAARVEQARALCRLSGAVVVLKGARTVIAAPGHDQEEGPLAICPTGNAAMGTGGMGDVLTGITGALLCAGLPAFDAACAAVYWHGRAGDLLSRRALPGALLLAGEVCAALPEALRAAREPLLVEEQAV